MHKNIVKRVICTTHNVGRAIPMRQQAAHPPPTRPFEHVMMDFVELTPCHTGVKFLFRHRSKNTLCLPSCQRRSCRKRKWNIQNKTGKMLCRDGSKLDTGSSYCADVYENEEKNANRSKPI